MQNKLYTILLVAGILLLINMLSRRFFWRLDLTEDKQYTLSKATTNILKNLDDLVTVKAYFSEDLPPSVAKVRRDFKEMLIEYEARSGGNLAYEFINPNETEETKQQAAQNGIAPIQLNVREKDQMKVQQAFMGAIIEVGTDENAKEVIPAILPQTPMEYTLSTTIKKVSTTNKPSVGIVQGYGAPPLQQLQSVAQNLSVLYTVEPVDLSKDIELKFKTVALLAAKDSIPVEHFGVLDRFLERGGNLFIGVNRVDGNLQNASGTVVTTGLETWLSSKGIMVEPSFLVDVKCGAVTAQQNLGNGIVLPVQIPFHYIPVISNYAKHPITEGLEAVMMQFVSQVNYVGDSTKKFTPLAFTSDKSGSMNAPLQFDIRKEWTPMDLPLKRLTVGGILEGNIVGSVPSKMVVMGDGDFPFLAQDAQSDNGNLMVNAIDYLSDDTGLISLRTKGVTTRPIEEMEDSRKQMIKWMSFLLPILLVGVYGFFRTRRNRMIRMQRMEADYS